MGIVVIGDVFIDIKGFSTSPYIPYGRNAGTIAQIHGGVGRNVAEDIANVELEPTFVSSVDDDAMGEDVIRKLDRHKVNTKYMRKVKNGMNDASEKQILFRNGNRKQRGTKVTLHIKERNREKL